MIDKTITTKIIDCHNKIHFSMKAALDYALEAGRLLTEVKEESQHGEFLPWLKENMPFSERTARNYIKVFNYRDKTASVADLQEAYRQIETIEAQEKQTEKQRQESRVADYVKTGRKADDWKRGTDDKRADEVKEKARSDEQFRERVKKESDERLENKKDRQQKSADAFNEMDQIFDGLKEQSDRQQAIAEKMNLGGDNASHDFNVVLIEYLGSLNDDTERLEACHNIIKICKGYVTEYQKNSIRDDKMVVI